MSIPQAVIDETVTYWMEESREAESKSDTVAVAGQPRKSRHNAVGAEREQIRYDLIETLNATLAGRGIVVEDVPMRAIVLPAKLTESIERKLQMEQESQRMDFVLQKEQQEAKRKSIEAQGIADFQRIVSNGIDDKLLRWKGIEATVELAKSDNAKVVVVGSAGTQGMPLILGK